MINYYDVKVKDGLHSGVFPALKSTDDELYDAASGALFLRVSKLIIPETAKFMGIIS